MKPSRLIAVLFMVGVLVFIVSIPIMCVAGIGRGMGKLKNGEITINSDWVGDKVKIGKNVLTQEVTSISQEGVVDVHWVKSKDSYFVVEGKPEFIKKVKYEMDGSELKFGSNKVNVSEMKHQVQVTVYSPSLSSFSLAGTGNFNAEDLRGNGFDLNVAGEGDVLLSGNLDQLDIDVAGHGDINAGGLVCKNADVSISGNSDLDINAIDTIEASVVGIGTIRYKGNPKIDKSIIGKCQFLKSE